jgi:hypothetical protein
MTYKNLLDKLMMMDEEQINQSVTIYDTNDDEYIPVSHTETTSESDVLDENHFYLVIN